MRPATWHRLLALALAGFWAVLPLAGALHDAEHAHRYCAEHGAVEEAGATPEGDADADGSGLHAWEGRLADLHTACGFSFVHRLGDGAGLAPGAIEAPAVPRPGAAPTLPVDPGATGLPALARAPKGSPPAA